MRNSAFQILKALFLMSTLVGMSRAQELSPVSIHRTCIAGGTGEKLFLRYWSPDANNGIAEPVCVFKASDFGGLHVRSVHVLAQRNGGALVTVEFDESARPMLERMSRDNVDKLMAVVVDDRIVSMPLITRPYSDDKLVISVSNDREAARIAEALAPSAGAGKKQ